MTPKIAGNALKLLTSRGPRSDAKQLRQEDLESVAEVLLDKRVGRVQRHFVYAGEKDEAQAGAVWVRCNPRTTRTDRKATPHDIARRR